MKNLVNQFDEPEGKGSILHLKNGKKFLAFYLTEYRSYQIFKDVDSNYWAYDPTPEIKKVCEPLCKTFEEVQELINDAIVLEFAGSCFESEYGDPEKYRDEDEQLFKDQEEQDLLRDEHEALKDELDPRSYQNIFNFDGLEPYANEEEAYWGSNL